MFIVGLGARCQGENDETVYKQTINSLYYVYSSKSVSTLIIKGVKKVFSAVHHRIFNQLKGKDADKS